MRQMDRGSSGRARHTNTICIFDFCANIIAPCQMIRRSFPRVIQVKESKEALVFIYPFPCSGLNMVTEGLVSKEEEPYRMPS